MSESIRKRDRVNKEISKRFGSDFLFSAYLERGEWTIPVLLIVLSDSGYQRASSILRDFYATHTDLNRTMFIDVKPYHLVSQSAEVGDPIITTFFQRVTNTEEHVFGDKKAFGEIRNQCADSETFEVEKLRTLLLQRTDHARQSLYTWVKSVLGLIHFYSLSAIQHHILTSTLEEGGIDVEKSFMTNYGDVFLNKEAFSAFFSSNEQNEMFLLWKAAEESFKRLNKIDPADDWDEYQMVREVFLAPLVSMANDREADTSDED